MGVPHIQAAFSAARAAGRAALMPYFTLGYPDADTSMSIIHALAAAGADLIELGLPFSDPLADGPTIQRSTQIALAGGMTLSRCLEQTAQLRTVGISQPLLLMGYVNPILAFGVNRFVAEAAACGADGLILPDLPLEESAALEALCASHGMALVHLAAPSSPDDRLSLLATRTRGFLYLVSIAGVTGARTGLPAGLAGFVARARRVARTPIAVGFGISTPEQAKTVGALADGVIVGSALIDAVDRAPSRADAAVAAGTFLSNLREALEAPPS